MTTRFVPVAALAGLLVVLLNGAAHAASPAALALEEFGFLGVWSVHCDRPASPGNIARTAYLSASGEPGFTESLGPDLAENVYRILDAKIVAKAEIVLDIELNGQIRQKLTMTRDGDRIRTLTNQLPDGRTVVKEGTIVTTGTKTPWLNLCEKTP
jgi:hypothetical protein